MRIAVAGLRHETNTFSPLRTGLSEFTIRRDAEILQDPLWAQVQSSDVTIVPTLTAEAAPHGLVAHDAYMQLAALPFQRLRRPIVPLDAVGDWHP